MGCLHYSYSFYMQYHGGIREITSMPVLTFYFMLCSILLIGRKTRFFFTTFVFMIQKKDPDLNLTPSPQFVATLLRLAFLRFTFH